MPKQSKSCNLAKSCKICNNPTNDKSGVCAVCKVLARVGCKAAEFEGIVLPKGEAKAVKSRKAERICICGKKFYAKGLCWNCYKRERKKKKKELPIISSEPIVGQATTTPETIESIEYRALPTTDNLKEAYGGATGKNSIIGQLLYASDLLDAVLRLVISGKKVDAQKIIDIKSRLDYVLVETN